MKNFNRSFAMVRRSIRKDRPEQAIQRLTNLQQEIQEKMDRYVTMIEGDNKVCCPVEDRILSIAMVDSATSKLIINPVDGKTRLKVSEQASEVVICDLINLVGELTDLELPPVTLRGKITWHKHRGYECQLVSGSKKFKKMITYNPENK